MAFKSKYLPLALSLFLFAGTLHAQSTAERLGYSSEDKLLIVHTDDIGLAHSVNRATFDSFEKGVVNSGSAMVPCPWFPDVAEWSKKNKDHDIGLHLTLTAEWKDYRWDGVKSTTEIPSLIGEDGYMPRETSEVKKNAKGREAAMELRAQVEKSLAMGLKPTHLDTHMGAVFETTALTMAYVQLGIEYGIPVMIPKELAMQRMPDMVAGLEKNMPMIDRIAMADPSIPSDKWFEYYADVVRNLKPGITEIIIHVGYDDPELQAVMEDHPDYGSAWRQGDFDVFNSEEMKALIEKEGIKMVTWREIGSLMK